MSSSADRDAFLREMGITDEDILNPDNLALGKDQISKPKARLPCSSDNSYATNYKGAGIGVADAPVHPKNPSARPDAAAGVGYAALPTTPGSTKSPTEALKLAGNDAFEQGQFAEAIRLYTKAIKLHGGGESLGMGARCGHLPSDIAAATPIQLHSIAAMAGGVNVSAVLLATLYSNRAAAYLQAAHDTTIVTTPEAAYESALCDAEQAVGLRPDWFKAYARQGDAYFKLRQFHQAAEAYQMALCMEPGNVNLANALAESQEQAKLGVLERLRGGKKAQGAAGTARRAPPPPPPTVADPKPAPRATATAPTTTKQEPPRAQNSSSAKLYHQASGGTATTTTKNSNSSNNNNNTTGSQVFYTPEEYRIKQLEEFRRKREEQVKKGSLTEDTLESAAPSTRATMDGLTESMSATIPDMIQSKCHSMSSCGAGESAKFGSNVKSSSNTREHLNGSSGLERGGPAKQVGNQSIPYAFSSEAAAAYQQKLLEEYRRKNANKQSFSATR